MGRYRGYRREIAGSQDAKHSLNQQRLKRILHAQRAYTNSRDGNGAQSADANLSAPTTESAPATARTTQPIGEVVAVSKFVKWLCPTCKREPELLTTAEDVDSVQCATCDELGVESWMQRAPEKPKPRIREVIRSVDYQKVNIPLSRDNQGATMFIRTPLLWDEWLQLHQLLEVMGPSLVVASEWKKHVKEPPR